MNDCNDPQNMKEITASNSYVISVLHLGTKTQSLENKTEKTVDLKDILKSTGNTAALFLKTWNYLFHFENQAKNEVNHLMV